LSEVSGKSDARSYEFESPYINAPLWPWSVAGWSLAALFALLFVLARSCG
jgi:hypothetical protein